MRAHPLHFGGVAPERVLVFSGQKLGMGDDERVEAPELVDVDVCADGVGVGVGAWDAMIMATTARMGRQPEHGIIGKASQRDIGARVHLHCNLYSSCGG